MSLEDFFTLTEMNDGLTAPSRVRELVAVMQKERDCAMNTVDTTRQRSAVASTIAATKNKDCLDLFLHLNGLQFMDKWLKDTQKFSSETDESIVEKSISHLLQALDKLHVDNDKLVSSEIWNAVKDLLGHKSSKVLDRAQALLDTWEKKRDIGASPSTTDRVGPSTDVDMGIGADIERESRLPESSFEDAPDSVESSGKEKCQESTKDDPSPSTSGNALEPVYLESAQTSYKILDCPNMNDRHIDHVGLPSSSKPASENMSVKMGPVDCCYIGTKSAESCSLTVARQDIVDEQTDFNELDSTTPKTETSPEKLGLLEDSKPLGDQPFPSTSGAADASSSATEPSLQKLSGTIEKVSCQNTLFSAAARKIDSEGKGAVDDGGCSLECRIPSALRPEENDELNNKVCQNSSASEQTWENPMDSKTFLLKTEDEGGIDKFDQCDSDGSDDDLENDYEFAKRDMERKPDVIVKKSVVELDYGILDPLEVARKVAIEVERELGDYREQSCSSSDKAPKGKIQQPDSPESVSVKRSHASNVSPKEVANDSDLPAEASPMQEESVTSTEKLDAKQINGVQEIETSQVTEAVQEEPNTGKGLCNFDLNQEIHSEDTGPPENQISNPVSVVSASRATSATGLPVAPLHFEGEFGWKGSAATSAFRPASPLRMPECDKDLSTGGSNSRSKQQRGCLGIDLNIAESEDGGTEGLLLPDKLVLASSTLLSEESSVEANSRSERIVLDLNRTSEVGDVPSDWTIMGQFFPKRNGHQSQTDSSSSSLKQSSLRNIDLNDQPSFLDDSSDHSYLTKDHSYLTKLSQNLNASGGIKSDDTVISIMGTRVEVKRKDSVPQSLPLPNGITPEFAFDVNLDRTGRFIGMGSALPYAHSVAYSYNGIPPGHAMPFSSTMYGAGGPIPYMVDSRGAPVVPQILGSASGLAPSFSQPPFLISMTSSALSNGIGPSQDSFDLNSRSMLEGGSRGPAGMGRFFNTGPARSAEMHLRPNSQPFMSSTVGEKRKEPDSGWEYYPFKHHPPPWN